MDTPSDGYGFPTIASLPSHYKLKNEFVNCYIIFLIMIVIPTLYFLVASIVRVKEKLYKASEDE